MKEKIVSHTSHAKLQYYRHNYCLVTMTGSLGCRWHRYQQSTRDSRKRDFFNFFTVFMAFLYIVVFFIFWLAAKNDIYFITVDMFHRVGGYIPWYGLGLGFSSGTFAYLSVIMILCVLHVIHGHQLYIHLFHIAMCYLILGSCVVVSILVDINWPHLWPLLYISLKVYGPFILLTAVIVITVLSWLLIRQWFRLSSKVAKAIWASVFSCSMLTLYFLPLAMDTTIFRRDTPSKPGIVAIGGASHVAPENTKFAFDKAINLGADKLYSTVQISFDGVPFLMSDKSLQRTTDIDAVFPNRTTNDPSKYTMAELEQLNAGLWFFSDDPWDTSGDLSEAEREEVERQTVPRLSQLVQLATDAPGLQLYLTVRSLPDTHPYSNTRFEKVAEVLANSTGVRHHDIFVPPEVKELDPRLSLLAQPSASVWDQQKDGAPDVNTSVVYMPVSSDIDSIMSEFRSQNISTLVLEVNSAWFLSYLWCADVNLVATHDIEKIAAVGSPILHMNEKGYLAVWLTADILSFTAILAMFIVQRVRLYGTNFSPEAISLSTGRVSLRSRTMKEKLLREGAVMDTLDDSEMPGVAGIAGGATSIDITDSEGVSGPVYSMSASQTFTHASIPVGARGQGISGNSHQHNQQQQQHRMSGSVSDGEVGLSPPVSSVDRYSV